MNKFKVGDEVRVVEGNRNLVTNLGDGNIYTIEDIHVDGVKLKGIFHYYHYSIFELYIEEDMKEKPNTLGILTPLQAAEAILNGDKLQVYDIDCNKWYTFAYGHRSIAIEDLKHIKLRLKPKTMVVNGVEVPAPLDLAALGYPDKVYGLNFSRKSIYGTTGHTNRGLFWTTEEDAQKVLDAMLILFNES